MKSSYPNSRLVYTHPEHPPPPLLGQAIHRDTHKYPYNLLPAQFDNCNLTNYATKELYDLHNIHKRYRERGEETVIYSILYGEKSAKEFLFSSTAGPLTVIWGQ